MWYWIISWTMALALFITGAGLAAGATGIGTLPATLVLISAIVITLFGSASLIVWLAKKSKQ